MHQSEPLSGFPALFEAQDAAIRPGKPFLVGPGTLAWGLLFDRMARTAALFERHGLARGDRIVIASADDEAVITLFMASLRFGTTAVILNPEASADELAVLIPAADARLLVMDPELRRRAGIAAAGQGPAVIDVGPAGAGPAASLFNRMVGARRRPAVPDTWPSMLATLAPIAAWPQDLPQSTTAYILFTSGTTSRPKGVEISHRALFAQMATFVRHYGLGPDTRLLNVLPLHHTDGLTQGAVVTLVAGASLHRPFKFRIDALPRLLDLLWRHRISHFVTVPSVLALIDTLGEDHLDAFAGEDFRFVISTAAFLDETLWKRFEQRYGVKVVNVYGLTETVCESLYCGPDEATRRMGTIGKPIDSEARIVDEAGREVAVGETGELILSGPHLMTGYFRMPEETRAVLRDGWFHTGDLARADADGFYRIVGRKKTVIITAGMNVYPEDVTAVLMQAPGVLDAVTFGMPDATWGERVVSAVVPAPGAALTEEGMAQHVLAHASPEKLPREIHIVGALPRGPAGKVVLAEARRLVEERRAAAAAAQPGASIEEGLDSLLLGTAAEVFKTPREALDHRSGPENTKGWNSLAHVEFLMALEERFSVRMTPHDIMSIRSLGDARRVLEGKLA